MRASDLSAADLAAIDAWNEEPDESLFDRAFYAMAERPATTTMYCDNDQTLALCDRLLDILFSDAYRSDAECRVRMKQEVVALRHSAAFQYARMIEARK